jgi:hypothetical protein
MVASSLGVNPFAAKVRGSTLPPESATGTATNRKGVAVSPYQIRAGDGARTRDIQLGKLVLYQLSYTRISPLKYKRPPVDCKVQYFTAESLARLLFCERSSFMT